MKNLHSPCTTTTTFFKKITCYEILVNTSNTYLFLDARCLTRIPEGYTEKTLQLLLAGRIRDISVLDAGIKRHILS